MTSATSRGGRVIAAYPGHWPRQDGRGGWAWPAACYWPNGGNDWWCPNADGLRAIGDGGDRRQLRGDAWQTSAAACGEIRGGRSGPLPPRDDTCATHCPA